MKSEHKEVYNTETGAMEFLDTKKLYSVTFDDSDRFFQVYVGMLQSFYEIKYIKDCFLLVKFAELANYNTGHIELSTKLRGVICEDLSINPSNLSTSIKRLIDAGLLFGDKGSYTINAGLFWKGDAKKRKELLEKDGVELTIQFKANENFSTE
jgi:hypothetical protein